MTRKRSPADDWQVRLLYRTPNVILEEPFEAFVSALCLLSGVPLLFGAVSPSSVEAELPPLIAELWGVTLVAGSVMVLWGLRLTHGTTNFHRMMTGRRIERFGLLCLCYAASLYAACVLSFLGTTALVNAAILLAFALTCAAKVLVLSAGTRLLHKALTASVESYDAGK